MAKHHNTTTPPAPGARSGDHPACHVLRCLSPASWLLTISDHGRTITTDAYCGRHAGQWVESMALAGRRITLDAIGAGVAS